MEQQTFKRQIVSAEISKLRSNFPKLIVGNPNYFGNLSGADFLQPIQQIQGNTHYENLGCLGLQPQFNLLKAVVYINQDSGYSGQLCSAGSQEYVRFYLSFDDGVTWIDQGVTSLNVHDVKHEGRLEYAVEMPVDIKKHSCKKPNQLLARAILSWNVAPPANTPNYTPVWGNVVNAHVLAQPAQSLVLKDLIDASILKEVSELVDVELKIPTTHLPVNYAALERSYNEAQLAPHRFAYPLVQEIMAHPSKLSALQVLPKHLLGEYKFDLSKVIEQIANTDGNIDFEELNCIGLQPKATLDQLVGVLKVKKPQGYSGNLCTPGSREYVRFYLDFGSGWQDMGLTSVQVHDISTLPKDGFNYAVFLPVDLSKHRKPCKQGPVYAKMRAILSWSSPPPANTPDYKPVWGNAENTTIMLTPGVVQQGDKPAPIITAVCGQSVAEINSATGTLTNAAFSDAPFANSLWISGHIGNAPDASSGAAKLKYRLNYSTDGVIFKPVANAFQLRLEQSNGGIWTFPPSVNQTPSAGGYVEYQEDLVAPVQTFVNLDILGVLHTVGDANPYRWLQIEVIDSLNPAISYLSDVIKVRVDNVAPTASIAMDQGSCSDIKVGDAVTGSYTTADDFFGGVSLAVLGSPGGVLTKTPSISTSTGETGTWRLETAGMTKCGYVVQLTSSDRALIGYASGTAYSASGGHYYQPTALGFCLR
ncbi:hypothetical protein [Methylotenera versatilis]|uniref:Uncharacterized protein n=1 Tax=Methylotenera versatilis (strain 301) TaxID=666681 RepID=D7DN09_METV0|nr:hypothetical protein [Methylotenera versatilis]ADI28948.1 conserved hypothetical protein [Methylotenera versatilis 301]